MPMEKFQRRPNLCAHICTNIIITYANTHVHPYGVANGLII